ncbi:MAG: baseplate J/gp47 family protein, partial [Caldilineaceae bacterium]|nr:baseplate J/gp47 family protein [Caldilineaceae bacterium]
MTELLHIEPDTKPDAIRRRLARLGSGPVAVVLPNGWSELDSFARLRLLQRQARLRNQDLALVTQDLETRRIAQALGIPVYGNEAGLVGRTWRMKPQLPDVDPRNPAAGLPEPPAWRNSRIINDTTDKTVARLARPSLHRSRQRRIRAEEKYRRPMPFWLRFIGYIFAGLAFAAMLGAFVYFVLPAATVTVVPGQRPLEAAITLTADPGIDIADFEIGVIPARLMETYVERTGTIPTSGSDQAATDRAGGSVVFTNQTNRTIRIPAGTVVSTSTGDRVDFRTLQDVDLNGPTGTRVTVNVEATEQGTRGNVRADTITTVSGALQGQVQVTNPAATGGGASNLVRIVTQADRDALYDQVYAEIEAQAYTEIQRELREGEWTPAESVQTFVIDSFYDHFNDEPADTLTLSLRVLVQGVAVDQGEASDAAFAALEDAVPERGKLVADSIQYFAAPDATVTNRTVEFSV